MTSQRSASSGIPWFRAASWSSWRLIPGRAHYDPSTLTARAVTSTTRASDTDGLDPPTRSFAAEVSGIVSVGLNAIEFVSDTYM